MVNQRKLLVVTVKHFDCATVDYLAARGIAVVVHPWPAGKTDADATQAELTALLADADAWIVGHARVTADLLESLPRLRIIARRGVGYEKVDIDAAVSGGKVVTIAAGGNEESVADHTLALMLSVAHRLGESHRQLIDGPGSILLGHDLYAKTVGLVGLGRIGRSVAKRLRAFDVTILATTPRPPRDLDATAAQIEFVDLDTLLQHSDFVSLHAPLKPETAHLIGATRLASMKRSAYLINTSRGGLVDDQALLAALQAGQIAGAGLDVFESELRPELAHVTQALVRLANVVATPHSGASTHEGLERTNRVAAHCVVAVLAGEQPPSGCVVAGPPTPTRPA